ncbi:MAG: NADH-ubiquinone oxidoreductase chain [Labilithrix sp.]|nr:NADH-ubiquinone oxidoreductase chain [Labilithrix sp.]
MASKVSPTARHTLHPAGRPAWVIPTFVVLALVVLVVAATQLLGRSSGTAPSAYSATNAALGGVVPFAVAAALAALIPWKHTWRVRLPLAIIAGLFALFVLRMWPGADVATAADGAPPAESTTILSWLIGLPLLGAIAILFLPRQLPQLLKGVTFVTMLGTFAASLPLLRVEMGKGYHFNQDFVWIERFGIHYHVALDGISLWLVMLTVFVVPIAAYVSFGSITTRIKDWCFSLLLLEAAMIGAFVAVDLFLFYVFWEMVLIPMYVMIGVWGGANRIKASLKFFLYTMFGSMLMLAAILYVAYTYGRLTNGPTTFDYFELQRIVFPRNIQIYLFIGFAASFLIKVPMFPMHTWLPDAHTEAPTAGSIILAAIMLKMGTYGYLRFCMGLFPEIASEAAATLGGVAVIGGILYGGFCAWRQDDVKRLVAYSSVAHLGYVMLGLFAGSQSGMEGAVLQMINHGISTPALFLLVGVIYDRRHTRMLDEFGGLAKVMPVFATLFIIATLASVGLPGTNGFTGEFLVITGTFVSTRLGHVNGIQAVGAALGVIVAALYMLTAVQRMFFGPITREENKRLKDINARELLAVSPLIIAIFVIGLAPNLLLGQMRGAIARTIADTNARVPRAGVVYDGPIKLVPRRPEAPAKLGAAADPGADAPAAAAAPAGEGH